MQILLTQAHMLFILPVRNGGDSYSPAVMPYF